MINIGPNTFLHRFVPVQSGIYGVASQFKVDNTSAKFDVLFSGNGSISFALGIESGKVFASGTSKKYFDVLSTNTTTNLTSIQVSNTGYDIFINSQPQLVSQTKATGNLEKIYFIGGTAGFTGTCEIQVFGNPPNLQISNPKQSFILPRQNVVNTGVSVTNFSNVDTRVLTANIYNLSSGNMLTGQFPILVKGGEEKIIPFSGRYSSDSLTQSILSSYIADFSSSFITSTIVPTEFSGLGVRVTQLPIANNLNLINIGTILVENTGTVSALMYPLVVSTGILIGYSGFNERQLYNIVAASGGTTNLVTGIVDPKKFTSLQSYPFFYSDRITSKKSDLFLIQHPEQIVPTYVISGSGGNNTTILESNHAGRAIGFFKANAVGHSFVAPYDFASTFITLPLRGNGDHLYSDSGNQEFWKRVVNFSPTDRMGVILYSGTGLNFTGSGILTSSWVNCSGNIQNYGFWGHASQKPDSSVLSSYASGFKNQRFDFGQPVLFNSGATYTILLSGSGAWMNGEVSGQRYITWQGLYHTGYSNPNPENGAVGPLQKTNGSGFCISNTLSDSYYRAMGYATYQPNSANFAPIGDDNFGGTLTLTGFLRKGTLDLQRFYVSEDFVPNNISLNFTSDDTDTQFTGVLYSFQGSGSVLHVRVYPSLAGNPQLPDLTQIVCSGARPHKDFYQHHLLGNVNRPVGFVQERMFPMGKTSLLSGNHNYWLVMSGENYPDVNNLFIEGIPVVRFSHNFVEPDSNYRTSLPSGFKLVYDYINGVYQSGDPSLSPSSLRSSQRLTTDTWIQSRIFGNAVANSGTRKQTYETPMSMCFMLGISSDDFNVWDTNPISGVVNEFLNPNSYSYNKFITSRLFTITNDLPVLLNGGERVILNLEYNGLQGFLDYALLEIPQFNFTGLISGFTS